jgi:hypothetical protein
MRSTPPQSPLRPTRPALIVAVLVGRLNNCGLVARRRGNDAQAAAFYEESLAIRWRLGDCWGIVGSLSNLGTLAYHQGDVEAAARLYLENLLLVRQLGDRVGAIAALLGLVQVARVQGDLSRAARLVGATDALLAATGTSAEAVGDGDYPDEASVLRALLSVEDLAAEMEVGRHMTLEEAIACAGDVG